MTNIPTELLRTLIAVVDLRSFTKAAQALGVTQPAVSAQIKRLQVLLGGDLFDKSAPGVALTEKGEVVVNYARRLLSINDQILDLAVHGPGVDRLRIGLATDLFVGPIFRVIAGFRTRHPDLRLQVQSDYADKLMRDMRRAEYDLVFGFSIGEDGMTARHVWSEEVAWVGASAAALEADEPVPLAVLGDGSLTRRLCFAALEQAGRSHEVVFVGHSFAGLMGAVTSGLGLTCCYKRMVGDTSLVLCDGSAKLPRIPNVVAGIYLRDGSEHAATHELADALADAVRPPAGVQPARREVA